MVRLKYTCNKIRSVFFMFQFHYGSIKIISTELLALLVLMFQFHYGSIKITPLNS